MKNDLSHLLPLSPASLHILLALAAEDLHGYAIMQEVLRQSEGRYKLGPGTLYDNLQRLLRDEVVVEVEGIKSGKEDPRRRYYRLTPGGRALITEEIARLERMVREARSILPPLKALRPLKTRRA